jgi:hypothetical protein
LGGCASQCRATMDLPNRSMRKRGEPTDCESLNDGSRRRVRRRMSEEFPSTSLSAPGRRSSCRKGFLTPASSSESESHSSKGKEAQLIVEEAPALEDVFPFLELPAELRVHVYRMALQRDEPLLLHRDRLEDNDPSCCETSTSDRSEVEVRLSRLPKETSPPSPTSTTSTASLLDVALLRTCKLIYKEARQVLYADNTFTLLLPTGIPTLSHLHQRSRSLIKSVALTVPSHHDILDGFADLVRLGLRYCWRLESFTILLDGVFPDDRVLVNAGTSVYATAFHILRFLPRKCKVVLKGEVTEVVRRVVEEEARLLMVLDEVRFAVWIDMGVLLTVCQASHLRRQHQMPDRR